MFSATSVRLGVNFSHVSLFHYKRHIKLGGSVRGSDKIKTSRSKTSSFSVTSVRHSQKNFTEHIFLVRTEKPTKTNSAVSPPYIFL